MKCFHSINLTIPVLKDSFILPKHESNQHPSWPLWKYSADDILSKETINWWKMHGCVASHSLLFHAIPNSTLPIHIDTIATIDTWACNWIIGEPIGMEWYKSKTQGDVADSIATQCGTNLGEVPYKSYTDDMLENKISKTILSSPTIIRIGVPHGGFNDTDNDGWIVSVRFKSNLTFVNAVEKFWSIRKN
jgi:hypothetical protein